MAKELAMPLSWGVFVLCVAVATIPTVTVCALLESHDFSPGSGFEPWAIASPNHRSELESARDSAQDPSRAQA